MSALDIFTAPSDSAGECPRCSVPYVAGETIVYAENDGWAYQNNPGRWIHGCKVCCNHKFKRATNGAGNEKHLFRR